MSWSHLGAITKRIGLCHGDQELLDVRPGGRERPFERLKRTGIVGRFTTTERVTEPFGREAVAHLLASGQSLREVDGVVERSIDVRCHERTGRVDGLTLVHG